MTVLDKVFASLETMTQWQLLLAFIACIGYAFAQGSLLQPRGRRVAWIAALLAAAGFVFESRDWTLATMLLAFAMVGLGSFVLLAWLTCRALGFGKTGDPLAGAEWPSTAPAGLAASARRRHHGGEPVHSLF